MCMCIYVYIYIYICTYVLLLHDVAVLEDTSVADKLGSTLMGAAAKLN